MNKITYNGVTLESCLTRSYDRVPQMNGPDWLYTDHELHFSGVFNGKTVPDFKEVNALKLDKLIRHQLGQNHCHLTYEAADGEKWIDHSPKADLNNGPDVLYVKVQHVLGTKSLLVDMGVRWSAFEGGPEKNPPALISNRWTGQHLLDGQAFLTSTYRGRAVFNTAVMAKKGAEPDQFRKWLLLPCPKGFRREVVDVTQSQDRAAYEWVVVDRQQALDVLAPGISHIDIQQTITTQRPGLEEQGRATAQMISAVHARMDHAFGLMQEQAAAAGKAGEAQSVVTGVGAGGHGSASALAGLRAALSGTTATALIPHDIFEWRNAVLPRTIHDVVVTVLGHPTTSLKQLVEAAMKIARVKSLPAQQTWGAGFFARLHVDYQSRMAIAAMSVQAVPAFGAFGDQVAADGWNEGLIAKVVADEPVKDLLGPHGSRANEPPKQRHVGVGVSLITQALQDPAVLRNKTVAPAAAETLRKKIDTAPKELEP